ncbi:hypothetical protein Rsub_06293 [Raphidocelis subcapitata]|uniref:Uncharacterized protein n=1 Tax=Raphidocelis subcapitata TaxID=307507 RepID=A0A2V0P6S4_9CHLO|nr:hypothetical protein Rsub_06293 [Raphidocelis subcapitata]|eukprot:GBF93573.1 hypothetical protein Rsub_06293 [Raphidocelis subcapitata]
MPPPDDDGDSYIPLNVSTYREGFLRLQGWTCVSALAFLTGALLVLYELLFLNVEDRDFRDMLHDYRTTQPGVMYQHRHFVNSEFCCHHDRAVFGYACQEGHVGALYLGEPHGTGAYAPRHPHCPPTVVFTCASLVSPECRQTRAVVYAAAGLDPLTGAPTECARAGRVRLHARAAPGGSAVQSQLTVEWRGQQVVGEELLIANNTAPNTQEVFDFFDRVAARYAEPLHTFPSAADPPAATFQFFTDSLQVPLYRLRRVLDAEVAEWMALWGAAEAAAAAAVSLPQLLADGSGGGGSAANGSSGSSSSGGGGGEALVELWALSSLVLRAGSAAPALDACGAWMLDQEWVEAAYGTPVWNGTAAVLAGLLAAGSAPAAPPAAAVSLQLRDVAEPLPLALPRYGGNAYVYGALAAGGVWAFATVPLLGAYVLVLVNVQRNRGLPLFIFKYMRRYRGW